MLHTIDTGGGCTAIRFEEPEVPDLYVLVTDEGDPSAPDLASGEPAFDLGVYREEDGQDIAFWSIRSREELNAEYEKLVGYRPDDESKQPYADLVELFAGAVLFNARDNARSA